MLINVKNTKIIGYATTGVIPDGIEIDESILPNDFFDEWYPEKFLYINETVVEDPSFVPPSDPEPVINVCRQVDTLPIASIDELDNIYQYIGATTQDYTHGYFYECVSDGATVPTYSWAQTDVQPGADGVLTMLKADFDAAKAAGTLPHNQTIIIPDDNGDVTNQIWIGTRAEHTAAEIADTLPYNAIIGITDET